MKTDKSKLIQASKEVFEAYPLIDLVLATQDGHFFLPQARSQANDHARRNGTEVLEIKRSDLESKPASVDPPVADPVPVDPPAADPTPVDPPAAEPQDEEVKEPVVEAPVPQMRKQPAGKASGSKNVKKKS